MEVSGSSEVGISPVLLQAINQLQKSKQGQVAGLPQQVVIAGGDGNTPKMIKVEGATAPQATIVQQTTKTADQQNVVSSTQMKSMQPGIIQTINGQKVMVMLQTVVQPEPKKVIVKSISGNVVNIGGSKMVLSRGSVAGQTSGTSTLKVAESDQSSQKTPTSNVQMGNVLSAIASHVKSQKSFTKTQSIVSDGQLLSPHRVMVSQNDSTPSAAASNVVTEVFVHSSPPPLQQVQTVQSPPIKRIKLSPQQRGGDPTTLEVIQSSGQSEVPTPLTVVKTVSGHSFEDSSLVPIIKTLPNKLETISRVEDYSSPLNVVSSKSHSAEPVSRVVDYPVQLEDGTQVILQQIEPVETTVETAGGESGEEQGASHIRFMMQDPTTTASQAQTGGSPCPICGDRISGYHYGIFTCESCKGFFKRTVQNKKAFICHRKGECDINIVNRKKCPACRFKRCLIAGMKLEAVRGDRQRGGRSSYEGAVQYAGKPKTPSVPTTPKRLVVRTNQPQMRRTIVLPASGTTTSQTQAVMYEEEDRTMSTSASSSGLPVQPYTPQVLEDLLAVESLMAENEGEQECCMGKFQEGDENMFSSLLHFADHCLYKIVRWARNLPDFANVSTDDQILLLQNSWGELLCMCCSWNSIHHEDMLKLAHGRMLDIPKAQEMDILEVTQKLINFTSHLRSLELDLHEYVALKVMLLLNPDVKNLQDSVQIRAHQEMVCEYLLLYTTTHYPAKHNKFCQLIARLPELSRSCIQAKEILKQRQGLGEIPQYSLLSELLKGDAVVQSS